MESILCWPQIEEEEKEEEASPQILELSPFLFLSNAMALFQTPLSSFSNPDIQDPKDIRFLIGSEAKGQIPA